MGSFRVKNLMNFLSGINKIFDTVRIINPIKKEIVYSEDNFLYGSNCYEFWGKEELCDNCISKRAMVEKNTIVKIEYSGDKMFIVIASPFIFGDDEYIVEMIKDITETELSLD